MKLPFRRKAITATSNVTSAITGGWRPIALLGSGSRERIQGIYNAAQSADYAWMYENSPAVRAVIDVIVRNVGQLELRLYEEVDQAERSPKSDHPASLSLRYPNEQQSGDSFLRTMFKDWLIHDNAYALIVPAPNEQYTITHVPTYMVQIQGQSLFAVDNYRIWNQGAFSGGQTWGGSGTAVDVPPENMIHWHGEHPTDPRRGISLLDTLRPIIAEDAALQAAITELANAGMTEAVWAFRPETAPELTQQTRMKLEEDLSNRLRSRNRRPVVLEEGTEFRSFGVSPRDAEMMEVRKWALTRIAAAYGVPSEMVNVPSSRGDNTTMSQGAFYADCLMPICKNFTRFLNHRLLVRVYDWQTGSFEFNLDEKLMGDQRLTALVSASGRPVLLTNEARAMVNRPPIPGGDELVTPANVIVGDNPVPAPGVMPIQDPNKPAQDGSARQDQPPTPIPSGNGGKAIDIPADGPVQLHPRRSADARRQAANIVLVEKAVRRNLRRVGGEYGKAIGSDSRTGKRKAADQWQAWTNKLSDDLLATFRGIVDAEGSTYLFKLGGGQFDMGQVQHYLEAKASGAADGIMQKIRKEVTDLGPVAALDRIDQHVASAGGYLGVTATTFAREEAAKQSPVPDARVKTWVADTQRHAQYDGQTIPIGEDWPQGFSPGQRGCRCTESVS